MKVLAKFNEFKGGSNRGYLPHVFFSPSGLGHLVGHNEG